MVYDKGNMKEKLMSLSSVICVKKEHKELLYGRYKRAYFYYYHSSLKLNVTYLFTKITLLPSEAESRYCAARGQFCVCLQLLTLAL